MRSRMPLRCFHTTIAILAALCCLLPPLARAGALFTSPSKYQVGKLTMGIAAGDFDRNGTIEGDPVFSWNEGPDESESESTARKRERGGRKS
jgi:hypothetical protein